MVKESYFDHYYSTEYRLWMNEAGNSTERQMRLCEVAGPDHKEA